jgi:hypothetical protein
MRSAVNPAAYDAAHEGYGEGIPDEVESASNV